MGHGSFVMIKPSFLDPLIRKISDRKLTRNIFAQETLSALAKDGATALKRGLTRIGVEVIFYCWIEEGRHEALLPPLQDEANFAFDSLDVDDLKAIMSIKPPIFPGRRLDPMLERLQRGSLCFGAKYKNEYIAWTWVDFNETKYRGKSFALESDEAYLQDIFVRDQFRGRNIAPHLRKKTYAALKIMKFKKLYSISEPANYPSVRFKSKLGAEICWFGLCIIFFQKYYCHWKTNRRTLSRALWFAFSRRRNTD